MEEELVERVGLKGSSNTKGCKRMRLRAHPGKVWEADPSAGREGYRCGLG